MKHAPTLISVRHTSTFQLDTTLTGEEAIVLRALAAGQTCRQVCEVLRMHPTTFLCTMRDIREKTGTVDNASLIEWAKEHLKGIDQRVDRPERCALLA